MCSSMYVSLCIVLVDSEWKKKSLQYTYKLIKIRYCIKWISYSTSTEQSQSMKGLVKFWLKCPFPSPPVSREIWGISIEEKWSKLTAKEKQWMEKVIESQYLFCVSRWCHTGPHQRFQKMTDLEIQLSEIWFSSNTMQALLIRIRRLWTVSCRDSADRRTGLRFWRVNDKADDIPRHNSEVPLMSVTYLFIYLFHSWRAWIVRYNGFEKVVNRSFYNLCYCQELSQLHDGKYFAPHSYSLLN